MGLPLKAVVASRFDLKSHPALSSIFTFVLVRSRSFTTSRHVECFWLDRLVENKLRESDRPLQILRQSFNHELNLVSARQS